MRDTSLEDFLSKDDIEALYRPVAEAVGLPGRVYGAEFYALEQRRLFPRVWCPVGFARVRASRGGAVATMSCRTAQGPSSSTSGTSQTCSVQ